MFSGKTSSLEKEVKRFNIAGYKTVAFKPTVDSRYPSSEITSHDKTTIEGIIVEDIKMIMDYCEKNNPEIVAIDEVQFLGGEIEDIKDGINDLLSRDITVILAGLDMDFSAKPFEILKEMMPFADYLTKHHAVCTRCGTDAWVSHRKTKATERVVIGATREYEPLCRSCFLKEKKEDEAIVNKNQVKFIE